MRFKEILQEQERKILRSHVPTRSHVPARSTRFYNMKKYKDKKQFRYKGYDYSKNGFYFVTICVKNREMFFGDITETGTQNIAFLRPVNVH